MSIKKVKITRNIYTFILSSFIYNLLLSFMYIGSKDVNELIINIYSNIDLLHLDDIRKIILWIFPQLIIVRYFGNFFEENLLDNTTVIFTRTNKRSYFLLKNILSLFINFLIFFMVQVICIIIVSVINKIPVNIDLSSFLIVCRINLYYFLMLLIINGLSVLWKSINVVYIVMLLKMSMIYLSGMLLEYYNLTIKYLPINIGIIFYGSFNTGINNIEAITYCLLYILLFLIIILFLFRKKEFLS